jgi:polygalacturonase
MHVNDDAVVLKGGKGTWADMDERNGDNQRILIEHCIYGKVHGCLTLGSESLHDRNIILRNCVTRDANRVLWLKMRPDTPQTYEYVMVEDIEGNGKNFLLVAPWTQFYDLKGRESIPMSYSNHITMRNITFDCNVFFNVKQNEDQYHLSNFTFENLAITAQNTEFHQEYVENFTVKNVKAEKKP